MRAYLYVLCMFGATLMIAADKPKRKRFNKNDCVESKWTRKGQRRDNQTHGKNFNILKGSTQCPSTKRYNPLNKVGYEDQQNI